MSAATVASSVRGRLAKVRGGPLPNDLVDDGAPLAAAARSLLPLPAGRLPAQEDEDEAPEG
eukprot:4973154-Heterocapsa_arctica.AAC.1